MTDQPHVDYTVTGIVHSMEPDGNGNFTPSKTVHYESADGHKSHVTVPAKHFTAPYVHALINHDLTSIREVAALPGSVTEPPAAAKS